MGSLFKTTKSIKTIFFDIGGVVVTAPMTNYLKLGTEIFECEPKVLNDATARHLPGLETGLLSSEEFWEKLSGSIAESGHGKSVPSWKFKGFWEGILTDVLQVNREVVDLVRKLKAHVRVAVLSNVIKEHAVVLQREQVYEHFNPVVLSCKVGLRKPDPAIFVKAAEIAKTKPDRCMLIDDDANNIEAAKKAGFETLHFFSAEELTREIYRMGLLDNG